MLVPVEWAREVEGSVERFLTEDGWELTGSWRDGFPVSKCAETIDSYSRRAASWNEQLLIWGDEKSNDIQLFFEADDVVEICARIDMRRFPNDFLRIVPEIASALECRLFVMETGLFVDPTELELKRCLRGSQAAKSFDATESQ